MDNKPLLIAALNFKGGVGKSTISTQIAVAAVMNKWVVAFYDLDPQQTSAYYFSTIDEKYRPQMIYNNLAQAPKETPNIVILDCPPNMDVIPPKDFLLISPTSATSLDLHAFKKVLELEKQGYNVIKVINYFNMLRNDDKELLKQFEECVVISQNSAITVAMNNGKSIWNTGHPGGKRAKRQFNYLLSRIRAGKAEKMDMQYFRDIFNGIDRKKEVKEVKENEGVN